MEASVRRGRPSSYDRAQLIAVAKRLGPDRLSLTTVANELGVPRTTLYNSLTGPDSLGQLVLSSILSESGATAVRPKRHQPWHDQLEAFAHRERTALLAAGPWLRFYDPSTHITPDRLRLADHLIEVIVDDGVPMSLAARALALITQIVQQSILDNLRLPWGDVDDSSPMLDGLDPEVYPSLAAARLAFEKDSNGEAQYRFSLRCALAGIAAMVGPRT